MARLKIAVHRRAPSNLAELEEFSHEEWVNISPSHCVKLVEPNPKRLITVIAAKGASTKCWPKGLKYFYNQWILICTFVFAGVPDVDLLQLLLQQCLVWSLRLWIKKLIWKICFYIIHNSSKCGTISRGNTFAGLWIYGYTLSEQNIKNTFLILSVQLPFCPQKPQFVGAWTPQGVESIPQECWPMLTPLLHTVVSSWLVVDLYSE